ncbi:MAG: helix-turn-helix transcriptional regulator [Candidatus Aminicenantes bacterium]|nr:helix-turn-helix transcriptional regulator [Candidatus Aminicenantes bacterium]
MKHNNISESIIKYVLTLNDQELSELTRYKLAEIFGINKNYLSKKFKKDTCRTVCDFLDFEKMKRAERLLKTSSLTVKTISKQVGISKHTYFVKKFQEIYGLKPGNYRELFKPGNSGDAETPLEPEKTP